MENNGKGIFYGVIGVATLIVAIIGATFAFFSASASSEEGAIGGETLDVGSTALTLAVDRVDFDGDEEVAKLVPANFGITAEAGQKPNPADITTTMVGNALAKGCVDSDNGYTGCHVYKITASTTDPVNAASVLLDLSATATSTAQWGYALYRGTDSTVTSFLDIEGTTGGLGSAVTALDIHDGEAMTGTEVYYLMVFLNDDGVSQNNADANDATGEYTGSITFQAGTGQVSASFAG